MSENGSKKSSVRNFLSKTVLIRSGLGVFYTICPCFVTDSKFNESSFNLASDIISMTIIFALANFSRLVDEIKNNYTEKITQNKYSKFVSFFYTSLITIYTGLALNAVAIFILKPLLGLTSALDLFLLRPLAMLFFILMIISFFAKCFSMWIIYGATIIYLIFCLLSPKKNIIKPLIELKNNLKN